MIYSQVVLISNFYLILIFIIPSFYLEKKGGEEKSKSEISIIA